MQKLVIEHPKITKGIDDAHTRLSATVKTDHFTKELYYEVENEYSQYLCEERGDAFFVGLLYFAMVNGYDMEIKAPVSERLHYQLTKQYIPTMVKYMPTLFKPISVDAPLDSTPIKNAGAVGASATRGVDSFYSILKNRNLKEKDYNITHLMVCDIFGVYMGEEKTRNRFAETVKFSAKEAKSFGLPLVAIYSNEHEFWFPRTCNLYMFTIMAFVYAVQKLFAVYNFSAGYEYKHFTLETYLSDHYDFFTAQLVSNENLTIYSSGPEASRIEKLEFIVDDPVVQKNLKVCNVSEENCCECDKCTRTQTQLWVLGKLQYFSEVFPKAGFDKKRNKILRKMIADPDEFETAILKRIKQDGLPISLTAKVLGKLEYYTLTQIKRKARTIPAVRQVYFEAKRKRMTEGGGFFDHSSLFNNSKEYAAMYNDIVW